MSKATTLFSNSALLKGLSRPRQFDNAKESVALGYQVSPLTKVPCAFAQATVTYSRQVALPPAAVLQFGPFRLDLAAALLTRSGQAVALRPKAFDVLARCQRRW